MKMAIGYFACLAILFAYVVAEEPMTWHSYRVTQTSAPTPRREAMAEYDAHRNQIIMFGGRTLDEDGETAEIFDDTWILDLSDMTWTQLDPLERPPKTYGGVSGVIQSEGDQGGWFVISSGQTDGARTEHVWVYSLESTEAGTPEKHITWYRLPTYGEIPKPRYGAAGSINGDQLYLSHGTNFIRFADTYVLDLEGLAKFGALTPCRWTQIGGGSTEYSPAHPHPRFNPASTVNPLGLLVMFGGCLSGGEYAGPCPSRDAWVYNTERDTWTWTADGPGQSVLGRLVNIENDEVLLWGGGHWSGQLISSTEPDPTEIHVLDPLGFKWRRYKTEAFGGDDSNYPDNRVGHIMVSLRSNLTGDTIVMWGGDGDEDKLDNIYVLTGNLSHTEEVGLGWFWFTYWHLHGLFMFVSLGVTLQLGICLGRYWKGPGTMAHKACNFFSSFIAILGIIFGFVSAAGAGQFNVNFAHAVIGIVLLILIIFQPLIGVAKPSGSSACWQIAHKGLGIFIVILAISNIFLGFIMALLNRIAWAFVVYAILLLLLHLVCTAAGLHNRGDGAGAGDYTEMDDGVFKSSEVFKAGTKGGSSALYQ